MVHCNVAAPCRTEEWTCFNRRCITPRLLCNGQDDCRDNSDESYAHARCRGMIKYYFYNS